MKKNVKNKTKQKQKQNEQKQSKNATFFQAQILKNPLFVCILSLLSLQTYYSKEGLYHRCSINLFVFTMSKDESSFQQNRGVNLSFYFFEDGSLFEKGL